MPLICLRSSAPPSLGASSATGRSPSVGNIRGGLGRICRGRGRGVSPPGPRQGSPTRPPAPATTPRHRGGCRGRLSWARATWSRVVIKGIPLRTRTTVGLCRRFKHSRRDPAGAPPSHPDQAPGRSGRDVASVSDDDAGHRPGRSRRRGRRRRGRRAACRCRGRDRARIRRCSPGPAHRGRVPCAHRRRQRLAQQHAQKARPAPSRDQRPPTKSAPRTKSPPNRIEITIPTSPMMLPVIQQRPLHSDRSGLVRHVFVPHRNARPTLPRRQNPPSSGAKHTHSLPH